MTRGMIATLGLAISGQIAYQIGQRSVPHAASPWVVLTIAYFAGGVICVVLAWPFGVFSSGLHLRPALAWPTWVIAAAIVAIELGYLTAYRSGWTIGTAFTTASTVTTVGLALIGWMAFGSALSLRQLAGIALSCVSVWLISSGSRAG